MRCLFVMVILMVPLVSLNSGAPTAKNPGKGRMMRSLNQADKDKLIATCRNKKNKCKGQTDEHKATRENVKTALIEELKSRNISSQQAENQAEARLNKIYELKKKVHAKSGLSEIEPADNGLWEGDLTLTDDQVDFISKNLDNPRPIVENPMAVSKHKRSAAYYFEQYPNKRWPTMPIHYWVSGAFSGMEKFIIDSAFATLSSSTGCIKFVKDTTRLESGSQIHVVKVGSDGCYGWSGIGYHGINTVSLGTVNGCNGDVLKGLVMHETIHALGGGHEQSRTDRDDYVQIIWDNIDPQESSIFQFQIDEWSTSYGVPYDYKSVMHYKEGAFAKTRGLKTMVPTVAGAKLGGSHDLSSNDINQLKKMYCKSSTCRDKYQDCGTWALDGDCANPDWVFWMKSNCRKSCNDC